jgi:glyoxylase-like metal-dependent hydrolase (beta-lactamase superfamily II)
MASTSKRLKYVLLTHAHADHAGGCRQWKDQFGVLVLGSAQASRFVQSGDEEGISLTTAKAVGFYPADYRFEACPVDQELKESDVFQVGD